MRSVDNPQGDGGQVTERLWMTSRASVDEDRPSVDRAGTERRTRCHNMLRCDRSSDHYILWFWA